VSLIVDAGWWRRAESSWFLVGWSGFAVNVALLVLLGVFLWRYAPEPLAVAGGALLANVATAFAAAPIGDVDPDAKYAHNVGAVVLVAVLLTAAALRLRAGTSPPPSPGDARRNRDTGRAS